MGATPSLKQALRHQPTDAATLELARSFASEALHMVALQHRRIRSTEPEDETFVLRFWADLQFFVISLRRLRQAAELAAQPHATRPAIRAAIRRFERKLPQLRRMRNVGEHLDDYATGRGHDKTVERRDLVVGSFNDGDFRWLGSQLNIDDAVEAAESLYGSISEAHRSLAPTKP